MVRHAGGGAIPCSDAAAARVDAQGDVWDPEWDMLSCLLGAVVAVATLSRVQDRQIRTISDPALAPVEGT